MSSIVTLSLEIELAWGVHHLSDQNALKRHSSDRKAETQALNRLLLLCDELNIPLTFDVVGHLLCEDCSGNHDGPHPPGWFDTDPGTDKETDPLYYAPDLIKRIREAEVAHEICTHTFSHVPCQDVSEDTVDWELRTVRQQHAEFGLPEPTNFVPPMHSPPPRPILRKHGIQGVRRPVNCYPPVAEPDIPDSVLKRIPWYIRTSHPAQVLFRTHPVRDPRLVDGLVEHFTTWHASLTAPYLPNGQEDPHRIYQMVPTKIRQLLHQRYLHQGLYDVISDDSFVHFWSHLFNLSNDVQWQPIRTFLKTLASRQDQGDVNVATMNTVTNLVLDANV